MKQAWTYISLLHFWTLLKFHMLHSILRMQTKTLFRLKEDLLEHSSFISQSRPPCLSHTNRCIHTHTQTGTWLVGNVIPLFGVTDRVSSLDDTIKVLLYLSWWGGNAMSPLLRGAHWCHQSGNGNICQEPQRNLTSWDEVCRPTILYKGRICSMSVYFPVHDLKLW